MKGRQKGRPLKWVDASVSGKVSIGKPAITFKIWSKWKKKDRKVGTLMVSVGGIRWRPANKRRYHRRSWDKLAAWFEE